MSRSRKNETPLEHCEHQLSQLREKHQTLLAAYETLDAQHQKLLAAGDSCRSNPSCPTKQVLERWLD